MDSPAQLIRLSACGIAAVLPIDGLEQECIDNGSAVRSIGAMTVVGIVLAFTPAPAQRKP